MMEKTEIYIDKRRKEKLQAKAIKQVETLGYTITRNGRDYIQSGTCTKCTKDFTRIVPFTYECLPDSSKLRAKPSMAMLCTSCRTIARNK